MCSFLFVSSLKHDPLIWGYRVIFLYFLLKCIQFFISHWIHPNRLFCSSKDTILFPHRRQFNSASTIYRCLQWWTSLLPRSLFQAGLVALLICCTAVIVNIIFLSYIRILLDRAQQLPQKASVGNKTHLYIYRWSNHHEGLSWNLYLRE